MNLSASLLLIICALLSILLANSPMGPNYLGFWQMNVMGLSLSHWINDGLMAIFFLWVGLELKREYLQGELSTIRTALLPAIAALGGIVVPALIHYSLNANTPTQAGAGIPMATDIAFALGVLALLAKRVPLPLKVFLTALAVIDDLGAIVVIAVFYGGAFSAPYFSGALLMFTALVLINRWLKIVKPGIYLGLGLILWFLMLKSGVHATIAGVLLAFTLPLQTADPQTSPALRLEQGLHWPVAFLILPIFVLANTGIVLGGNWGQHLLDVNSLGIIGGLVLGKPLGIVLFSAVAVWSGVCRLPTALSWHHIAGAGALGGMGFTMSIFINNLAFNPQEALVNSAKMAIVVASLMAGTLGFIYLRWFAPAPRPSSGLQQ